MSVQLIKWCSLLLALEVYPVFGAPACRSPLADAPLSQDQLLSAARQYASRYMARLPSFVCTQTTEQFEAGKKAKHWRKGDSLTSQLVWDQGREQRKLELINNRPLSQNPVWRSPLISEGEFGNLLDSVLGNFSGAIFSWRGWDNIGEKRVGIFEYQVDQQHSSLRLTFGPAETVIAFRGMIYADETTGTVWRITNNANDFPSELKTKSISRLVDYGEIVIGASQYVLPVHATVLLDTGTRNIKNELRFEGYRKFGADSRISFAPDDLSKNGSGETIKR